MATRTVSNGGGNYNAAGTWVEGIVPTSADDVVFTATSGQLTVNVTSAAKTFVCTNYVNTLTINATLTISGNCTFVSGMSITTTSGTPVLELLISGTLTSAGKTIPGDLKITVGNTFTLADTAVVSGNLITGSGGIATLNGSTLSATGFTANNGVAGTTSFTLTGIATWNATGTLALNTTIACTSLTISNTATFGASGITLTYSSGTVTTTGSTLSIVNGTTLNTNGISWNNVTMNTGVTCTLTSSLDVNGNFQWGSGGTSVTLNGSTMTVAGSFRGNGTSSVGSTLQGTTDITLDGTGTWGNITAFVSVVKNNLSINTAGTITLSTSQSVGYNTGTFTYIAGTVVTTNSTLLVGATTTFVCSDMNGTTTNKWNNVTFSATGTYTISDIYLSGTFSILGTSLTFTINTGTIYTGGFNTSVSSCILTGTSSVIINTTGTILGGASTQIKIPVTVNAPGSTITFSTGSGFCIANTTLTYTAGTISMGAGFTLYINLTSTINFPGVTWPSLNMSGNSTIIINSAMSITSITTNGTVSFLGSAGFTTGSLAMTQAGSVLNTVTFKASVTYNIISSFTVTANALYHIAFVSDTPGTKAILTLQNNPTTTQDVGFCNATDIDSSAGATIWTRKGTITTTNNWKPMSAPLPVAFANCR